MSPKEKNTEAFLCLLMSNQRKIHSYILSLVHNFNDADDIMQETTATMWRKFDQFEMGTDFASWGAKVAYYQILNYRKKKTRDKLSFGDSVFDQISEIAKAKQAEADARVEMLRECIGKLKSDDQNLIKARYEQNCSVKSLAAQLNKSIQFIYKHISRIHTLLNLCIKKQGHNEGGA